MSDGSVRSILSLLVLLFPVALASGSAEAQVRFGGQLNVADETEFGLGPRLALDLTQLGPRFQIVGTWDIYFPDEDRLDYWEANGNVLYRFDLPVDVAVPYVGGGINVARSDVDAPDAAEDGDRDDTDLGLNVLGGVEFPLVSFTPFIEIRRAVDGGEQFYFTGGVLVP